MYVTYANCYEVRWSNVYHLKGVGLGVSATYLSIVSFFDFHTPYCVVCGALSSAKRIRAELLQEQINGRSLKEASSQRWNAEEDLL